ncbi:MAG: glutamate-1-semialdehyde 2,1-aminomutase [Candidatus Dormibacteraeota bacterium]|nr:glutamate-1-semialdehyde 2,1-aminomutase [Candidatus Dormibacteraeota bacterium]
MTELIRSSSIGLGPQSKSLLERAKLSLAGGVGSSARSPRAGWQPYPPFIASGHGSHVTDVDGNEFIDYLLGLGPMLLGHRPPGVTEAVASAIRDLGTVFGLPYALEAEAAERVVQAVPGIELVRFANSGSEAVGTAVRLARAATGRPLIVRFEGMYHGWMDTVYWSNHPAKEASGPSDSPQPVAAGPGIPSSLADTLLVRGWNDAAAIERVMAERGGEVAAILTEPVMLNTGCILPEEGYLQHLRDLTRAHGSLLIFDEVITGFRMALGGAQEYYGVVPDITTLAKGLGGGFPVAAIGGSREVMDWIASGRYSHSGTYNSNVIACAAVRAAVDELSRPGTYEALRVRGSKLMDGLRVAAREAGVPVQVQGVGPVFQVWFSETPIHNYRQAADGADHQLFYRWWQEMFSRGILFHPSQDENCFLSTAHSDRDIDRTLEAASEAFRACASSR